MFEQPEQPEPMTYGNLCKYLLEECGIDSKIIIKHRFALGFIAKAAREMPTEVFNNKIGVSVWFVFGDRSINFGFDRLSNHSTVGIDETGTQRPTETVIPRMFEYLYGPPVEPAPKAWDVRAWEWVKGRLRWQR
jgi:hypothetical protein